MRARELIEMQLKAAIRAPSGTVYTPPRNEPPIHFFAYLAAAEAGEFVDQGIFTSSDLLKACENDNEEEAVMDALRAQTLDGFVDWHGDFYDRAAAAELMGREGELDSMDLVRQPSYEGRVTPGGAASTRKLAQLIESQAMFGGAKLMRACRLFEAKRSPDMKTLKKHKVKLTDEERAQVMRAGAVWHMGGQDKPSAAVWKSEVNGRTWFVCNTHRAMASKPTLRGAIEAFKFIKTTS